MRAIIEKIGKQGSVGQGMGKWEPSYTDGDIRQLSCWENRLMRLKKLKIKLPQDLAIPLWMFWTDLH